VARSPGEGGPVTTGRSAPRRDDATDVGHGWSPADGGGASGGDHGSGVLEWRPAYQHEVIVRAELRHVACPSECEETPAAVVRIDNVDNPGEIAMTAADLSSMIDGLVGLRGALLASPRNGQTDGTPNAGDGR
jgi:hypothetical protein